MGVVYKEPELFTPAEAAVIANVTVRDINRIIDEHILPDVFYTAGAKRRVLAAACPLIDFYFHTADALTAEVRGRLIDRLCERIKSDKAFMFLASDEATITDWTIEETFFTVNFDKFFEETTKRYAVLMEARELVVEDPEILDGTPVIRGTRVPVYDVAASLEKGVSKERLRSAYPSLDDRSIELARVYAEASPLRGRPREKTPTIASKTVRRIARRSRR
ncbi:MAG: DUF433 domain-containing protein [Rhodospirillaceae bacterium]|nr:DUF433 domain-containing protein [Rhodospirillaceae bacterium]